MIYGRKQQQADNKLCDYVSCPYPHGNLSKEYNVFFNHNQIIHLLFKGFETEDELELRSKLSEFWWKWRKYNMVLGISYSDIFHIIIIVLVFFIFWRLNTWYNKKYNVPKVFQWFPRRWGKRKVSEHLSQLDKKLEAEGKGIWVTIYAIDLYIVTIPCTVKKYKS